MENLNLTDIRGELQDVANVVRLLLEVAGAGLNLDARSQAGLQDVGQDALGRMDRALDALRTYTEGNEPS